MTFYLIAEVRETDSRWTDTVVELNGAETSLAHPMFRTPAEAQAYVEERTRPQMEQYEAALTAYKEKQEKRSEALTEFREAVNKISSRTGVNFSPSSIHVYDSATPPDKSHYVTEYAIITASEN